MTEPTQDHSTDAAWEAWGQRDPYFAVITDPKFRRSMITEEHRREFFESGKSHAHGVLTIIRNQVNPHFAPRRVLDFGCGVGRVLIPLAAVSEEAVGLDVSPAMLAEARRNCEESGVTNVKLLPSDDELSQLSGQFDLVHSAIVFQHIPVDRGRSIFSRLLQRIAPGGVGAIQLTYSKTRFADTFGAAPLEVSAATPPETTPADALPSGDRDPEIQMNPYNMNEILFAMQQRGVHRIYSEFSDHGGELGIFVYFSVP